MRALMDRWFYRLYRAEEEGMASFEEVFGRSPDEAFDRANPFDGQVDDDADDDESDADDDEPDDAAAEGDADDNEGDDAEGDDDAPALAEWEVEMQKRFAPGTFTEEGWKAYRNMEILVSKKTADPEPTPPAEEPAAPPRPLLGSVAEIQTEEQLYNEAQGRPREVAMWAIDNQERLSPEQYENVMNIWFASNPHQYQMFWRQVDAQGLMGVVEEKFSHETAHQVETARDQGLKQALTENPLINQYRQQLGQYMQANPHLNDWVNNLRTTAEVKSAVEAVFYMMAGPELGRQVVENKAAQEAARLEAEAAAAENGEQAEGTAAAARTPRRSARPRPPASQASMPDDEYAAGIQNKILNMPVR